MFLLLTRMSLESRHASTMQDCKTSLKIKNKKITAKSLSTPEVACVFFFLLFFIFGRDMPANPQEKPPLAPK